MIDVDLNVIALSVEIALYLLLVAVALRRGALRDKVGRIILLYALASGMWVVGQLAQRLGWLVPLNFDVYLMAHLPLYGLVLLALIFLYVTRAFLRLKGWAWGWAVLGAAWITVIVALDASLIDVHTWVPILATWNIDRLALTFGASIGALGAGVTAGVFAGCFNAICNPRTCVLTSYGCLWSVQYTKPA